MMLLKFSKAIFIEHLWKELLEIMLILLLND